MAKSDARLEAGKAPGSLPCPRHFCFSGQALSLTAALLVVLSFVPLTQARADVMDCLPHGQPLVKVPELVSSGGVLRGTILLSDEKQRLAFRTPPGAKPGQAGTVTICQDQQVRVFRGIAAQPQLPPLQAGQIGDPIPGPTLRAKLGDIVALSFVNQINPNNFPRSSIDQAESGSVTSCDSSTAGYPEAGGDAFPDCFHGSSTGNIHFHGTHVNPNSTGDNVFIQVRPSPRPPNGNGRPSITPETAEAAFKKFFTDCETQLRTSMVSQWPTKWSDLPSEWTQEQTTLLKAYDAGTAPFNPPAKPPSQQLWPADQQQLDQGLWPQYYIGAFPYCFRIPAFATTPPGSPRMGQAPGTHWYHAHKHGSTAINVANGMTGVFIIEGDYDDALNAFYGTGWTRTQPVMVINQLGVSPNLFRRGPGNTDKGPDFSVNGRLQPVVEMQPGEVQMWRMANTSGRSGAYFIGGVTAVPPGTPPGPPPGTAISPTGFMWRQLAQDGVQFADANYKNSENQQFTMAAGNRVDLLIKAPITPGLYPIVVEHAVDPSDLKSANPVALLSVRVKAGVAPVTGPRSQFIPTAPPQPPFLADISDDEVKDSKERTIVFASTPPGNNPTQPFNTSAYAMHTIDGQKFNPDVVGQKVWLNAVEQWRIVNETTNPNIAHPFHIHVNPFQIVEVFDPNESVTDSNGNSLPKYVTSQSAITNPTLQCFLNPGDRSTWKDCHNVARTNRVWWDVFPIPSGRQVTTGTQPNARSVLVPGYFRMRSRFVDYSGWYVLHCHILAHEDRGMMTVVEVLPSKETLPHKLPYAHH